MGGNNNSLLFVRPFRTHRQAAVFLFFYATINKIGETRWHSWLRHCATRQKVAGSIPDGVTGIFHWQNPSGRTMALGLTQPLTEMSTGNISLGVKAAGRYGWQLYHLHVPKVLKSWSLNLLKPPGPVQACNWIALPFTDKIYIVIICCLYNRAYTYNDVMIYLLIAIGLSPGGSTHLQTNNT